MIQIQSISTSAEGRRWSKSLQNQRGDLLMALLYVSETQQPELHIKYQLR